MRDDRTEREMEEVIRASMKMTDVPSKELNSRLKAELYQREAALRKQPAAHKLSLWHLPMVLNLIMFSMLALSALIMTDNLYLSYFAAGICFYAGAAGILLTIVGVKKADFKEDITIRIEKRGIFA